jgi:hypothetical protein
MIRDKNINYKYQSLYFPASTFDWKPGSADNQDAGDGNDDLVEVGTTGLVGWKFDGGDDQVFISMPTPTGVDWDNDVFYRVIWAAAVSGDLGLTESFAISADEVAFGAAPATSAPTAFVTVSDTPGAINVPLATPWAKANSSTTNGIAGTSDVLRIFVDCTTDTANDPRLVGLELKYLPKLTPGPQTNDQADPADA